MFVQKEKEIIRKHDDFLTQAPFSDLKAYEQILAVMPANSSLHLANSTPVRYVQLFKTRPGIQYRSNRGTSGIDGCLSTAAGSCYASGNPTTVIAGDLAFIYDSNALWNHYLNDNFRIIVMNNGGGNIFSLIETSEEIEGIRNFFETPHKVNISHLTHAFGIKHYFCNNLNSLQKQLEIFFSVPGPSVLEVKTDGEVNSRVFKEYYRQLKQ